MSTPENAKPDRSTRTMILIVLGAAAVIAAIAWLPDFIRSQTPPARSPQFDSQIKVAMDAIERYSSAEGFAVSLAELEAQRELDALNRDAHTPTEQNVVYVVSNYWFAVRMVRVSPTKSNEQKFSSALAEVLRVE